MLVIYCCSTSHPNMWCLKTEVYRCSQLILQFAGRSSFSVDCGSGGRVDASKWPLSLDKQLTWAARWGLSSGSCGSFPGAPELPPSMVTGFRGAKGEATDLLRPNGTRYSHSCHILLVQAGHRANADSRRGVTDCTC